MIGYADEDEELHVELEGKRELAHDLDDAVKELNENWRYLMTVIVHWIVLA